MAYSIKEIFATLQGEGAHSGRAAVFCRFTGCNLWSGLESHRAQADCTFCDTDFVGMDGVNGGRLTDTENLARVISQVWDETGAGHAQRYVVFTGGEPLLQLDPDLIDAMHRAQFEIAIESNGTIRAPDGIDWICISPKPGPETIQTFGDELKLIFPQENMDPARFSGWAFRHFFLQPMDGPHYEKHLAETIAYCQTHPQWRLSLQTHKLIGIP
ncbi:7-carboxy-7-deazaguanine synthase [Candidatus Kirkpatrickella diaphorinae]|uniref:7-carboxy-7-deazaguanine synthase n=1 Tax=Candidatus Kirkpatrickella diaphorinae TaxID=2984322 RepID=A0ABY6GIP9_9PROT|nr:7-carboxy-7-deazaguanine synthase [Candidatus Kirkpatrickella diaphorinae]UYH50738.1 7-carboxy-7-deazaguanine synthase [Candidatus Kirkpatrickella diaphorinae]